MARQSVGFPEDDRRTSDDLSLQDAGLQAAAFWGWSWYYNLAYPTSDRYVPYYTFLLGWDAMKRTQARQILEHVAAVRIGRAPADDARDAMRTLERRADGEVE
ncbi:MAG: hypothetical protein HOP28_09365 [Gemmatimonadales bacterium]|nr:hypothetical protein [Gemmatimonadales bacterium]